MKFSILLFFFFLFFSSSITQNYRAYTNVLHIKQLVYYQRCSFLNLEWHVSYDWRVLAPNTHHSLFLIHHFVHTCLTWKLQVVHVYGFSTYWPTALISETFLLWFKVACEIQLESYGPRPALQSFAASTLRAYCKHKQNNRGAYNFTTLQSTPLWPRMIIRVFKVAKQWQSARYGRIHMSLFGAQPKCTYDNKTSASYVYTTLQTTALYTVNDAYHSIRTKWARLRHNLGATVVHSVYLQ